jgi:hypothetical protein
MNRIMLAALLALVGLISTIVTASGSVDVFAGGLEW